MSAKYIHANSLAAYWSGREDLFSKRELAILRAFRDALPGAKATDRQIMIKLGFTDPNKVRPRITELIDRGLLREVGSTRCPISGKTVRVVAMVYRVTQTELPLEVAS